MGTVRHSGIRCVLYSLGYGVYLIDLTSETTPEDAADHVKGYGLDVVETIPNPRDETQVFVITKHGRPPCILEKNQVTNLILSDLDKAVQEYVCHYLPKRLMMLKQEFGPKINFVN